MAFLTAASCSSQALSSRGAGNTEELRDPGGGRAPRGERGEAGDDAEGDERVAVAQFGGARGAAEDEGEKEERQGFVWCVVVLVIIQCFTLSSGTLFRNCVL